MKQVDESPLYGKEKCDTLDTVSVSLETAKRFADHYLALAQYWRQVARLPPVMTPGSERKAQQAGMR